MEGRTSNSSRCISAYTQAARAEEAAKIAAAEAARQAATDAAKELKRQERKLRQQEKDAAREQKRQERDAAKEVKRQEKGDARMARDGDVATRKRRRVDNMPSKEALAQIEKERTLSRIRAINTDIGYVPEDSTKRHCDVCYKHATVAHDICTNADPLVLKFSPTKHASTGTPHNTGDRNSVCDLLDSATASAGSSGAMMAEGAGAINSVTQTMSIGAGRYEKYIKDQIALAGPYGGPMPSQESVGNSTQRSLASSGVHGPERDAGHDGAGPAVVDGPANEFDRGQFIEPNAVTCSRCHVTVHMGCYGLRATDAVPSWKCGPCVLDTNADTCELCPSEGGAMKPTAEGRWAYARFDPLHVDFPSHSFFF